MREIQKSILTTLSELPTLPQSLLDVGCGNGYFTRIIADALPQTCIAAVDPSLTLAHDTSHQVRYIQSPIEALPFDSFSFDVVVACMSFHHWNDKQRGIKEAFRVLKPEGLLLIGDPLYEGIMRKRFIAWLLQKTDGGIFTASQEMEAYLQVAGFNKWSSVPVPNSFGTMFVVSAYKY